MEMGDCGACDHKESCRGGLERLSYVTYGDDYKKDPEYNLGKEIV